MKHIVCMVAAAVALAGCSAISVAPNASSVQLSNERPGTSCRYIGEATGSQGNFWTGDYTSNKNLMEGSRNDLRNKASAMGGNYVWVQNVANAQAHGSLGTTNTTVVGNVYGCPNGGTAVAATSGSAVTSPTPVTAGRQSIITPAAGVVATSAPATSGDGAMLVQQTLRAQKLASAQGCGDVQSTGDSQFSAVCTGFTLVIRCDGASCAPIRADR